jgi:hypothetical protein
MRNSPLAKSDESASSIRGEHWLGDAAVLEGEMLDGNDPIQPGNVHSAVVGGLTDVKSLPLEPPSVENEADDNNENADDDDFGAFGGALEADEMPTLSDEGPEEDEYVKSMDKPVGVSEGAVVNAAVVGGLTDIESLPLEPPSVENEADDNNENADDDDFGAFGGALEADEMPTLSDEGPEEDGLPVEYQHGITGMNVAGSALESLVQANETMSLGMQKSSAEPGWGLLDRLKKSLPDIFPVREKSADQDVVINSLGDSDDLHCIATSLNILRSGCSPFLVSSTKDRSSSSFLFAVKPASRSIPTTIATDEAKKSFEHFCRPVVGFKSLSRTADKKFACEIQNSFQVPSSGKDVGAFLHPARKGSPKVTRPILSRLVEPTMVSLPLPRAVGKEARQETTVVPSSHVKQFLQQIPDLSFMLSSKLSIPHTYS